MDDPEKVDPVKRYVDVYKTNIQSDGSLDKLKLVLVVRGYLHNKEIIEDAWDPTASTMILGYLLADAANNKERMHQLDFI